MIEKVTLRLADDGTFEPTSGIPCQQTNTKALLLYAAAKCAALTAQHIIARSRVTPRSLQVSVSGELSTDTVRSESLFTSFHFFYEAACDTDADQAAAIRAFRLTHEKHCSMVTMLGRIAPVTYVMTVYGYDEPKC